MKPRDKINWDKIGDLLDQYDACLRAANELQCLANTEAIQALEDIRQEIIEEIGGEDTRGG